MRLIQVIFPKSYKICEGHDWKLSFASIRADGVREKEKLFCHNCSLMVVRSLPVN